MTIWPLRVLMVGGTLVAFAGVGFGLFLLVMRLIRGSEWAAQGVFTLFAVLFIFIGSQFMALGLLGEYIGRIYQARARPWYFVRTVVGREHAAPPHATGTTKVPDVPQLRLHVP
jgi:undecaprenyl-phosphate 4-deoxy-4-formamido-L-arabinose transferase